ncbi:MAG TPA: hypothetical protein VEB86_18845 [Chryseosolibacter sp.]|nr:hypothetical protein [Chryseosolibacter sp.]
MNKAIFITSILIVVLLFPVVKFSGCDYRMKWGHGFTFENELGIQIDSLEIIIGDKKTMIYASSDSLRTMAGNIEVPENGYPHKVTMKIFSNGNLQILKADSFDCYNCDGSHEYVLRNTGAEYKFYN